MKSNSTDSSLWRVFPEDLIEKLGVLIVNQLTFGLKSRSNSADEAVIKHAGSFKTAPQQVLWV